MSEHVAAIDPINMALVRDHREVESTFWNHRYHEWADLGRGMLARFPTNQTVTRGEAQEVLLPSLREALLALRNHCASLPGLKWLALTRGSWLRCLSRFRAGTVYSELTPGDRYNVFRMMGLAALQFGSDNRHLCRATILEGNDAEGCLLGPAPVPPEDICALRELLDLCVHLFRLEKMYRSSGRGVRLTADGQSVRVEYPRDVLQALWLYDRRVNEQYARGEVLASAGIGGAFYGEGLFEKCLYVVGEIPEDRWEATMESVRKEFPDEFNPFSYMPVPIDGTPVESFLARMPIALSKKTRGLTPRQAFAAIRSLSRLLFTGFLNPQARTWLGCFGLLPFETCDFYHRFTEQIQATMPDCGTSGARDLAGVFLQTFMQDLSKADCTFDRAPVCQYICAPSSVVSLDAGRIVLIDGLYLHQDIEAWICSLELEPLRSDTSRGVYFEEWLRENVEALKASEIRLDIRDAEQGLKVRAEPGQILTDIDVMFAWGKFLFILQCKSRAMKAKHFSGDVSAITARAQRLQRDLRQWDEKMQRLFAAEGTACWRNLNPRLAELTRGCKWGIPAVVVPRPEWLPELSNDFLLRRGYFQRRSYYPIPRICTFSDLKELLSRGGPDGLSSASWVIRLGG